ncbi:hypothetical protein ACQ4PT_060548 [Festuca glaucescens]
MDITPCYGSLRRAWNRSFSPAATLPGGETPARLSPSVHILPSPPPLTSVSAKRRAVTPEGIVSDPTPPSSPAADLTPLATPLAKLCRDGCGRLVWRRVDKHFIVREATPPFLLPSALDASPSPAGLFVTSPARAASPPPAGTSDGPGEESPGMPLFQPVTSPLLQAPSSTPPRPPTTRRKTLAGPMAFPSIRYSPRLQAKARGTPVAHLAETILCRRLGIVDDDATATQAAIDNYIKLFNGRLLDIAVAALRALFRLDCDLATVVEDALLENGGENAPDLNADEAEVDDLAA